MSNIHSDTFFIQMNSFFLLFFSIYKTHFTFTNSLTKTKQKQHKT
jgi:hypothetical protein